MFAKGSAARYLLQLKRLHMASKPDYMAEFVEALQGRGRYTFTKKEVADASRTSETALKFALVRLRRKQRIVAVRRGFYVIVPAEYRANGILPTDWFIDDLMKFLKQPYYVGLLSAAAYHGAAHQQPQWFHIVTNKPLRPIKTKGLGIRFFKKVNIESTPTVQQRTFTGDIPVSTPAATALDLVTYQQRVGRLNRVMTVLQELGESIEADSLVAAAQNGELAYAQRLGWLLDRAGFESINGKLHEWLASLKPKAVALDPSRPTKGFVRDPKWSVIMNAEIEGEL